MADIPWVTALVVLSTYITLVKGIISLLDRKAE
jgi:hypothetical protein